MKVTIKYFGMFAEQAGLNEEIMDLSGIGTDLENLKQHCQERYQLSHCDSMRLAVNQQLDHNESLKEGDEIAFLPPFAGG